MFSLPVARRLPAEPVRKSEARSLPGGRRCRRFASWGRPQRTGQSAAACASPGPASGPSCCRRRRASDEDAKDSTTTTVATREPAGRRELGGWAEPRACSAAAGHARAAASQGRAAAVEFDQGARYADFNPDSDRTAEYGLAALIAGGVAAKSGLLTKLLAVLFAAKTGSAVSLRSAAQDVRQRRWRASAPKLAAT
ncbi:MAG: DUF2167 domain-containing protein [Rhodanobacteraceae bacterium]|nr:DUF2167 domain-containing protein [Rhodanobacteraceae bacterium]